jgi:hypothetical protein
MPGTPTYVPLPKLKKDSAWKCATILMKENRQPCKALPNIVQPITRRC